MSLQFTALQYPECYFFIATSYDIVYQSYIFHRALKALSYY